MASSTSTSTSNGGASRFSSLKVFNKFTTSRDKDVRPPPPPPKDEFYLRNRSMASLLPDNMSLAPSSPLSPQLQFNYAGQPSSDANQSTMSLASSAASAISSPPPETKRPQSRGKERALAFLKFGRRSPKSPSRANTTEESEGPDSSISAPWNFQHHIHVDDGLVGLPPSWSTSLAAHGFSEEEIAQLQLRRETRSPNSQVMFNRRPNSPVISHPYQPNGAPANSVPFISNPAPRTTSLPRQYSNTSLRTNDSGPHQRPAIPSFNNAASASTSSLQSSKAGSIRSKTRLTPQRHAPQVSVSYSSDSNHSGSGLEDTAPIVQRKVSDLASSRPKTHAVNGSTSSTSPPPNLNGQRGEPTLLNRFFPPQQQPLPLPLPLAASSSFQPLRAEPEPSQPPKPPQQSKRQAGSAPRLSISLHSRTDSSDLSSWAGAWLDGLASGDLNGEFQSNQQQQQLKSPQSAPTNGSAQVAQPAVRAAQSVPAVKRDPTPPPEPSRTAAPPPPQVTISKSKPRPLSRLMENKDDDAKSQWSDIPNSSSPLWSQLEGILGQSMVNKSPEEHEPYSAALAETFSPTLPISPEEQRMKTQRKMRMEGSKETLTLARPRQQQYNSNNREDDDELDDHRLSVNTMRPNRDSSRSSTSTISGLVAPTTIVRNVSIARRVGAYVIDKSPRAANYNRDRLPAPLGPPPSISLPSPPVTASSILSTAATVSSLEEQGYPPSPLSSQFDVSEEGYYNQDKSTPSSVQSQQEVPTPTSDSGISPLAYYLQPSPDPSQVSFSPVSSPTYKDHKPSSEWDMDEEDEDYDGDSDDDGENDESSTSLVVPSLNTLKQRSPSPSAPRPTIIISDDPLPTLPGPATAVPSTGPLSPFQRYRGWLSEVVAPLEEFIDETVDPRDHYLDLKEIAEGESGSVFSARLKPQNAYRLTRLPALVKTHDAEDIANNRDVLVAIKSVAIVPSGSPKLNDLRHELSLMKGLCHENLITLDALYVDLLEDTLWVRMELMERSLADVVLLVDEGLMLQDRTMARLASDILKGLEYLEKNNIAHRDIRSDNLLLNKQGILKITDFANAVQVSPQNPMLTDPAGVLYWQAPEIRSPPYNALKVDIWSLGATVWEMAETQPPFADTNQFADRWPSVQKPELYSPAFHEFLHMCSEPAATRPSASEVLKSAFVNNACGRSVIVHLLSQCIAIEASLA